MTHLLSRHYPAPKDAGGEGGIRTLARFYPANPLAGGPLEPLGYLSKSNIRK